MVGFLDLDNYVLLKLFEFCDDETLNNLYFVSVKCRDVIERLFYAKTLSLLICSPNSLTNQKTQDCLTNRDRITMSSNWKNGQYNRYNYFFTKKQFPSKILLEKDNLYMSQYKRITTHKRVPHYEDSILTGPLDSSIDHEIRNTDEISCFKKVENDVFVGGVCGKATLYENNIRVFEGNLHSSHEDIVCVDFTGNIFITGTNEGCKFWKKDIELGLIDFTPVGHYKLPFNVLKLLNPETLIGGLISDKDNLMALREINIERNEEIHLNSKTNAIIDLAIKDSSVLYTSNYDRTLRMYDRRINSDVCKIETYLIPTYIEHDGLNAILCATRHDSTVLFYDIRHTRNPVARYSWDTGPMLVTAKDLFNRRSDVSMYGIACDCRYLFVSTVSGIKVFDFK